MVGTYTTGITILMNYNIVIALFLGIIVSCGFGYLVSIPTLNLREDYLAIVTIAIGEVLRNVLIAENWIVYPQDGRNGGAIGMGIPNAITNTFNHDIQIGSFFMKGSIFSGLIFLIILTILLLIVYLFLEALYNSPWGRMLKGIRESDIAIESLGKDVVKYRRMSFIIGSGIAGFAGGLYALYYVSFAPDGFTPIITFNLWIIVILGGLSNNRGVILGSFFFFTLDQFTRTFNTQGQQLLTSIGTLYGLLNPIKHLPIISFIIDLITMDPLYSQYVILGIVLVAFLIFRPAGILPERPTKTNAIDIVNEDLNKEKEVRQYDWPRR